MLKIEELKLEMHIRLYGSCSTDLGRSIAEVTDNIHAIGVVKPKEHIKLNIAQIFVITFSIMKHVQ